MNDIKNIIKKWKNSFGFHGMQYKYFINRYNKTWRNERAVEIPIVKHFLRNHYERTLEVGNVTKNYYKNNYTVIDKYEKGPEVNNMDILDYNQKEKYEKIIAISTLEHVGKDIEKPELAIDAIKHLKTLLAYSGEMLITIPAGFNTPLEESLFNLGMEVYGLVEENGIWHECDPKKLNGITYNFAGNTATGLYILIFKKKL